MKIDTILYNGNVHTMDARRPRAQAIVIRQGKFVTAGMDKDLRDLIRPGIEAVNLEGRTVIPGLCDAHLHFVSAGQRIQLVDHNDLPSLEEAVRRIAERVTQTAPGTWVLARGWDQTEAFKVRYFELLFACTPVGQEDPYTSLLLKLYRFKTRQGYRALQASFVSKLVSTHDESRPIFDSHVSNFFGLRVPSVAHPINDRIAAFVSSLGRIQEHYEEWASDRRFRDLEAVLFRKQPKLKDCHRTRLFDFLVWTIGDKELT